MRKERSLSLPGAIIFAVVLLFSGHVDGKEKDDDLKYTLYLAYDSTEALRDQSQVATIVSGEGLEIDGVVASPQNMRYANYTPSRANQVVVDLMPGKYKIKIVKHISGGTYVMTPVEYEFQAGKVYRAGVKILKFVIEEHPSTKLKETISAVRSTAEFKDTEK